MWKIDTILDGIRVKFCELQKSSDFSLHSVHHKELLQALARKFEPTYEHAEFLGMGGSGVVIKIASKDARQLLPKCIKYPISAIGCEKGYDPDEALVKEAHALQDLHHQYIMPVEDFGAATDEGNPDAKHYYVMPFIDSIDLKKYCKSEHATVGGLVLALYHASIAMAHMHETSHIHLDIKPENIFVQQAALIPQ